MGRRVFQVAGKRSAKGGWGNIEMVRAAETGFGVVVVGSGQ